MTYSGSSQIKLIIAYALSLLLIIFCLCTISWYCAFSLSIVKYLNKKGITTITCQHAVYRPDVTESCIDILNLIDVPSKIRLAWGDVHNTIFEKYKNFKIVGFSIVSKTETNDYQVVSVIPCVVVYVE